MLRRDRLMRMQIHEFVDAMIFAFSFLLAFNLRVNPDVIDLFGLAPTNPGEADYVRTLWMSALLIPATAMVLEIQGFYSRPVLCPRRLTAWLLFKGCLFTSLGLVLGGFIFQITMFRWVILCFACTSFTLVFLKEEILQSFLQSRLGEEQYRRRFILVGTAEERARMRKEFKEKARGSIEVLAELDLEATPVPRLVEMLHEHSVNGVMLSVKEAHFGPVDAVIHACELEGVEVWLVADFFKTQISRTSFDDFYGRPVLVFRTTPETSWQGVAKQLLDFVGALALLLVSAVPMAIIAVLVKVTSPGPVLFRQQRSGLNGRPFTMYKFRTMVSNAEQFQHELAAMNEMTGPVFKVTNDPRVTPIGRWLRKFSLDEFPQLFNVLRGEMSLVGPRPLPVDEVKRFNDLAHRRRLSVKPGLTCLWQISGRNNVKDFKDWVRLDLEYIDNWSFWLDLKILWLTVPVVLLGTGAK
jgi:exopolysaccharide biosynthesis polyprenyl glycosylphosphotransferase